MFWWSLLSIQMFAALAEYSTYLQKRFPRGGALKRSLWRGVKLLKQGGWFPYPVNDWHSFQFFKPLFPTIFQFYFNYSFSPCRKFHMQPNYRANWKKYIFGLLFVYLFIAVPSKSVGCLIYCMKLFVLIWRPKLREISTGTSQQFVAVDLLLYINFNRTYPSRPIREVPPDGVFNVSTRWKQLMNQRSNLSK